MCNQWLIVLSILITIIINQSTHEKSQTNLIINFNLIF